MTESRKRKVTFLGALITTVLVMAGALIAAFGSGNHPERAIIGIGIGYLLGMGINSVINEITDSFK